MFQTLSMRAKLNALVAIAFFGVLFTSGASLYNQYQEGFEGHKSRVLNLVQSGLSIVTFYEKQASPSGCASIQRRSLTKPDSVAKAVV